MGLKGWGEKGTLTVGTEGLRGLGGADPPAPPSAPPPIGPAPARLPAHLGPAPSPPRPLPSPASPLSVRRRKDSLRLRCRLKPPSNSALPGEPGIMLV